LASVDENVKRWQHSNVDWQVKAVPVLFGMEYALSLTDDRTTAGARTYIHGLWLWWLAL
jgi:hypothetical protein